MDVLRAMGIQWNGRSNHIRCPYPDHPDHEPSWRWDDKRKAAFCSCIGTRANEKRVHDIFAVVGAKEGLDFKATTMRVAEIIGRPDLIVKVKGQKYQRTDAAALLSPLSENRDDMLVWNYLGRRLGIEPKRVPRPATKVVGVKSLAYFDRPQRYGGKPVHVGDFPAAIFETLDRDGKQHAHRIYLAPCGAAKADLGVAPDGEWRKAKKSAKKINNDTTAGRAVIWGDPSKAETELVLEGVETAAAAALAFETNITSGEMAIVACITAGGIEAFKPWPCTKRVTLAPIVMMPRKEGKSRHGAERLQRGNSQNCITANSTSRSPCPASRVRKRIGSTCFDAMVLRQWPTASSRRTHTGQRTTVRTRTSGRHPMTPRSLGWSDYQHWIMIASAKLPQDA
jgi:hypothetical protein